MAGSTRCQKVLIELRESNSVNVLTEGFGFEHQSFLLPFPDCNEKIWISTNCDKQIIIVTETNRGICSLGSFSENSVEFKGWVFVNINVWPWAHFSYRKVFLVMTDSDTTDTAFFQAIKPLLILCEVIEYSITDAWWKYDVVSVQNFRVVSFKTIVTKEGVHFNYAFRNRRLIMDLFLVRLIVEKILWNLQLKDLILIWSTLLPLVFAH